VYTSDVIAGLQWVLANHARLGIRVVSLSLSETAPSSARASALDAVVDQLWRRGVLVVTSAGNLGPGTVVFAPANDPLAITVGALDPRDTRATADDAAAAFSSSGTTLDGATKPELLAPGRHVVSVLPAESTLGRLAPAANRVAPGYAMMSGTSFAAPQVAAAAAILLQAHPGWTPDQVKWLLARAARPVRGSAGALDLVRALAFAGRPGSANAHVTPASLAGSTAALAALKAKERAAVAALDASSWNGASGWNASSWNASSWNASSWNASSWSASSWNASSWNAFSWN
jgi:serine protease AprX